MKGVIEFYGKDTKMGAYENIYLFDKAGNIIDIEALKVYSKTGRHWIIRIPKEVYGKAAFVIKVYISNSGKHYCSIIKKPEKIPKEVKEKIRRYIEETKHEKITPNCPLFLELLN